MRKGLFAVFIPLLMSLFFLKVNAWEYLEPIESGDYIYSILENDTAVLRNYLGTESNIIIPSTIDGLPVTILGNDLFSSNENIISVSIPQGIIEVGGSSFWRCKNLNSVVIPEGVEKIGENAFSDCTKLKDVTIGEGLLTIGPYAFSGCENLEHIELPLSLKALGSSCFSYCVNLKNVRMPSSLEEISYNTFIWCSSLKSITIPDGVTCIGMGAFGHSGLIELTFPSTVVRIEKEAFTYCTDLKNVYLNDGMKIIEEDAFMGCSRLTYINIPSTVYSIGVTTFNGCSELRYLIIPTNSYAADFVQRENLIFLYDADYEKRKVIKEIETDETGSISGIGFDDARFKYTPREIRAMSFDYWDYMTFGGHPQHCDCFVNTDTAIIELHYYGYREHDTGELEYWPAGWFFINLNTGVGNNMDNEPIDLTPYAKTKDDNEITYDVASVLELTPKEAALALGFENFSISNSPYGNNIIVTWYYREGSETKLAYNIDDENIKGAFELNVVTPEYHLWELRTQNHIVLTEKSLSEHGYQCIDYSYSQNPERTFVDKNENQIIVTCGSVEVIKWSYHYHKP